MPHNGILGKFYELTISFKLTLEHGEQNSTWLDKLVY